MGFTDLSKFFDYSESNGSFIDLDRKSQPLVSEVEKDQFTSSVENAFDYEFEGQSTFYPYELPKDALGDFSIGVIVGASGTGKSTLLSEFGEEDDVEWNDNKAVVSHFDTPQQGIEKLSAVGLNSIPTWCKPYNVLSTGEKFRANLARKLGSSTVIDEFTSVVDRNVAKSASVALSKYAKRNEIKGIVLATCHKDIIPWIEPDWVVDTDAGTLYFNGRYLQRPKISIKIFRCSHEAWSMFKEHHYLDKSINKAAHCFLATWNDIPVGFASALAMPNPYIENGWREHRTVVLPDFQGMGIGSRLSNGVAQIYLDRGKRYFSRTAHPKFGKYREASDGWVATSKNLVKRDDVDNSNLYNDWMVDTERVCYSHEYVGTD